MGSYSGCHQKDYRLKMNGWLWFCLVICCIAIGFLFFVLRTERDVWLNDLLDYYPLFCVAFCLCAWLSQLQFLATVSFLLEACYYFVWMIVMFSLFLKLRGVKYVKRIVCVLFAFDVVCNLAVQHYGAVLMDIAFCFCLIIGTSKRFCVDARQEAEDSSLS